ncbi:MAG TPA: protein kinase [Kofleriaceae bacterium]|nr:protein kinase [Kofleriaceae bacterium]
MTLDPGELIADRFEVEAAVGGGGMSLLYSARDRQSGERVAVKLMAGDRASVARFGREVQVLAELDHPAIVRYVGHGEARGGRPFLAMEWLEGEDLGTRLRRGALPVDDALQLAERVAQALGAAHARGVVHRDVKPTNLFLPGGRVEQVKVLDFGIARTAFGPELTQTQARIGTPAYMSPEQARGDRQIGAPADVFGLGVVLYQALTGRKPFVGDDLMALIARILLDDPPPLRDALPGCPPAVDRVVMQMLAKEPEQRFGDGAALATALADLRAALGADTGPAPAGALGGAEHRLACLVLARGVGAEVRGEVERIADTLGARSTPMADGTVAVLLAGAEVATDLTARGARAALAVRAAAPHAPIALVTGRALVAGRAPVGEVIDRAVGLLRSLRPGEGARRTGSDVTSPWSRDGETGAGDTSATRTGPRVPLSAATPPTSPARPIAATGAADDTGPSPILVDDVTAGLLDPRFEIGGFAGGLALRCEREAEIARTVLGRPTPFVARDAELAALEGAYGAAIDEPSPRAVLITAPAGLGKSRLVQELLARLERGGTAPTVLTGRGDPTSAGAPFGVVGQLVRRAAGLKAGEPIATQRQKLRARIGRHLDGADAARVTEFLGELCGVGFDAAGRVELASARTDARLLGDQMRRAWEDWLAAESRARPVVIVVEDLQWGDLSSLDAVDRALRNLREAPLVVVATARPELHTRFPRLWADRGLTELRLGELGRRACERIAAAALGGGDPAVVARLVERAGGHPLFLEELIRAAAAGHEQASPTVVAMVQARLEGLAAEGRRVLRAASVFGESFWVGGVEALLGAGRGTLAPWLETLRASEVIAARADSQIRGQAEWSFRHALFRDAAYAMLTPDDRALGHRLAAQWLEAAGERDPVRLAEHHERGGALARAVGWWRRAAEQALGGSDLDAALAHCARAVAAGASGATLGAVQALAAEAHDWRGEFAEAAAAAQVALAHLEPRRGGDDHGWFVAAGALATAAGVQGKPDVLDDLVVRLDRQLTTLDDARTPGPAADDREVIAATRLCEQLIIHGKLAQADELLARLRRGLAGARALGPGLAGRVHAAQALRARFGGDVAGNLAAVRAAVACFDEAGDLRNACARRERLGYAYLEVGDHQAAAALLTEAIATATRLGLGNVAATARHNLGLTLARLHRFDEAQTIEAEAIAAFRASGNRRMEGASLEYLALILLEAGDPVAAERAAREALAIASAEPVLPLNQAESLAIVARALLAQGRGDEAVILARRGLEQLDSLGGIDDGEAIIRLTWAEALAAAGRTAEAAAAGLRARARLLERAAAISDPALRASFLERVPENARTLALTP